MGDSFSSKSVEDLRKMLIDSGKYTSEQAKEIKGKTNLVQAVLSLNGESESEEENEEIDIFQKLLNNVQTTNGLLDNPIEQEPLEIDYNSIGWHDYVMKQFSEDEVIDGKYPTLFGLRRVAESLLGSIIQSGPVNVTPPVSETSPGRSTCVYTVVFDWFGTGVERAYSAVGGSYVGNTDQEYAIFPEAISEARAEGRALRKALKLKTIAAEEISKSTYQAPAVEVAKDIEYNENDPLTTTQNIFITQKCKEMKIDLTKLISKQYNKELEKLTKGEGKELVGLLNKYQTSCKDSLDVPEDIKLS